MISMKTLMREISAQAEAAGGSVEITNDIEAAFNGAEVIYAKSWGAKRSTATLSRRSSDAQRYRKKWIVDRGEDGVDEQCDLHALFASPPQRDSH